MNSDSLPPHNPYAPPETEITAAGTETVTILPRRLPYSIVDIVWQLFQVVVTVTVIIWLPIMLAVRYGLPPIIPLLAVFLAAIASVASGIHRLTLDADGITIRRNVGTRRWIPWHLVTRFRPATPLEVVLAGFSRPDRVCHSCLSVYGHFLIEWTGGRLYYPPRDPDQLRELIARWRHQATISEITRPDTSVRR